MEASMTRSLLEAIEAPEVEVFPGVYMTDFRSRNAERRQDANEKFDALEDTDMVDLFSKLKNTLEIINSPQNQIQVIEYDIKELETQIEHLKRSNNEILQAMKTDTDPILKEAVEENLNVILKKRNRIKELNELLETLPQAQHYKAAEAPPPPIEGQKKKSTSTGGAMDLLDADDDDADETAPMVQSVKEPRKETVDEKKNDGEDEEGVFL